MPSATNDCTRWRRCAPTARAIPISDRRSAASITKIMKISITPAAIENMPSTRKIVVMKFPMSCVSSTRSFFAVSTSTGCPAGSPPVPVNRAAPSPSRYARMRAAAASALSSVVRTPPRRLTVTALISSPLRPAISRSVSIGRTMPPATEEKLIPSTPDASSSRTTPATRTCTTSSPRWTVSPSPAMACRSVAARSLR